MDVQKHRTLGETHISAKQRLKFQTKDIPIRVYLNVPWCDKQIGKDQEEHCRDDNPNHHQKFTGSKADGAYAKNI